MKIYLVMLECLSSDESAPINTYDDLEFCKSEVEKLNEFNGWDDTDVLDSIMSSKEDKNGYFYEVLELDLLTKSNNKEE